MKKFRMFKSKRVLSTLICPVLITTMVVAFSESYKEESKA